MYYENENGKLHVNNFNHCLSWLCTMFWVIKRYLQVSGHKNCTSNVQVVKSIGAHLLIKILRNGVIPGCISSRVDSEASIDAHKLKSSWSWIAERLASLLQEWMIEHGD